MNVKPMANEAPADLPAGWGSALVGILLFVFVPLVMSGGQALTGLIANWLYSGDRFRAAGVASAWLVLALLSFFMVVLVISWVRGLPAWSLPYWIYFGLLTLYMTNVAVPGLTLFGHTFTHSEILGLRALIPLALVMVAAIILRPSLEPLRAMLRGIAFDWTRLTYAFYAASLLLILFVFDEVDPHPAVDPAIHLVLTLGALLYLRAPTQRRRGMTLLAALLVTWLGTTVYLSLYWHNRQEPWMTEPASGYDTARGMLITAAIILLITFSPWIITALRRIRARYVRHHL